MVLPIALTTTTTSWPRAWSPRPCRRPSPSFSTSATDEPPYFWTTMVTARSSLRYHGALPAALSHAGQDQRGRARKPRRPNGPPTQTNARARIEGQRVDRASSSSTIELAVTSTDDAHHAVRSAMSRGRSGRPGVAMATAVSRRGRPAWAVVERARSRCRREGARARDPERRALRPGASKQRERVTPSTERSDRAVLRASRRWRRGLDRRRRGRDGRARRARRRGRPSGDLRGRRPARCPRRRARPRPRRRRRRRGDGRSSARGLVARARRSPLRPASRTSRGSSPMPKSSPVDAGRLLVAEERLSGSPIGGAEIVLARRPRRRRHRRARRRRRGVERLVDGIVVARRVVGAVSSSGAKVVERRPRRLEGFVLLPAPRRGAGARQNHRRRRVRCDSGMRCVA